MSRCKRSAKEKYLTPEEYHRLLKAAARNERDYGILFLAGNIGLRVGELVRLRVEDIRDGSAFVPCLKRSPKGKGKPKAGKIKRGVLPKVYESIPILPEVQKVLDNLSADKKRGWLFEGNDSLHISERTAQNVFQKYRAKAGLDIVYSFHCLRHTRGGAVYRATHDIKAVKAMLRHKDVRSSEVYVDMDDEIKKAIANKVGVVR